VTAYRGLTWDHPRGHAPLVGFYSGTLRTTEAAWVRPRFPGYIEFQSRGSELIRTGLAERMPGPRLFDRLDALWRASLPTGAVL
jgi:multiple sugar transport system substrate-binding protein